jgi:hypothetical protein
VPFNERKRKYEKTKAANEKNFTNKTSIALSVGTEVCLFDCFCKMN